MGKEIVMSSRELEVVLVDSNSISDPNNQLIKTSGVGDFLEMIRPEWKAKRLIERTKRLLPVDPSSACQRIFNASIHDLRDKVILAGLDIASTAAEIYKLPKITSEDDIRERYDTYKLITLAYRMGLLSRAEYRRVCRVYDIRKDLEHEDDQYEAGIGDLVYTFQTCIEVILANDPIQIIKLKDIKDIIEEPNPVKIEEAVIEDYRQAPEPRQTEIYEFLISTSLDDKHPDIVRQNSYNALGTLRQFTCRDTILKVSQSMNERIKRRTPLIKELRVANISGILPYLRNANVKDFFKSYTQRLDEIGYHWANHSKHGEVLRDLKEVGGLTYCPKEIKQPIVDWLVQCYVGEPGGYGYYGRSRKVFYSNSGAPLSYELLSEDETLTIDMVQKVYKNNKHFQRLCEDKFIKSRYQEILDLFQED